MHLCFSNNLIECFTHQPANHHEKNLPEQDTLCPILFTQHPIQRYQQLHCEPTKCSPGCSRADSRTSYMRVGPPGKTGELPVLSMYDIFVRISDARLRTSLTFYKL